METNSSEKGIDKMIVGTVLVGMIIFILGGVIGTLVAAKQIVFFSLTPTSIRIGGMGIGLCIVFTAAVIRSQAEKQKFARNFFVVIWVICAVTFIAALKNSF